MDEPVEYPNLHGVAVDADAALVLRPFRAGVEKVAAEHARVLIGRIHNAVFVRTDLVVGCRISRFRERRRPS